MIANRSIRQQELVPPDKLCEQSVTIVGVGAIGRQVAIQLAAMGVPRLCLVDFDNVAPENLAAQGFLESNLGKSKVDAVKDMCCQINSEIDITTTCSKFRPFQFTGGVLMCCVDGIETRKTIFTAVKDRARLFIDGRMSAEVLRVLSVYDDKSKTHYGTTLFSAAEAYRGSCTAKTTIYCSNIAAGIMVSQFAQWLREYPINADIDFNLLTKELGVQ